MECFSFFQLLATFSTILPNLYLFKCLIKIILEQMKVLPFTIPKQPKENIVVQVDCGPRFYDQLHQHKEIQISHIASGKGKLIVGNSIQPYRPGDTFAIGSTVPHLFQSTEDSEASKMISLFFLPDAFGVDFFKLPEMQELKPFLEDVKFGIHLKTIKTDFFEQLTDVTTSSRFLRFTKLLELMKTITIEDRNIICPKNYTKQISDNHGSRLQLIFDYVIKNFDQEITLNSIADMAHMSPNSFCRFFKQRCNKSFFTFVTEVRIAHSSQLLVAQKNLSMSEIAMKSGFNAISNFNKQFKSVKGMSPSKYQKSILLA